MTPFQLVGYPIETVLAEKLVTMVAVGQVNTRERDFADVLLLTDTHAIDGSRLSQAITATAPTAKRRCGPCVKRRPASGRSAKRTGSATSPAPGS